MTKKKKMYIIILMAGLGERFVKEGYTIPKFLIEIEGRPMIDHVIDLFPDENAHFVFVCREEHRNLIKLQEWWDRIKNSTIIWVSPSEDGGDMNRKGPVISLVRTFHHIPDNEEIIVSYCDYGSVWNYEGFLLKMRDSRADGGIVCYKGFHPHMLRSHQYAFVKTSAYGLATQVQEKKSFTDRPMEEYASNGIYYFKDSSVMKKACHKLLAENKPVNGEFYVSMVFNMMMDRDVYVYEIEKMFQWGTPSDLQDYIRWSDFFLRDYNQLDAPKIKEDPYLLLPMAGTGTRFRMDGFLKPKPTLPIDGEAMIVRAVEQLPPTRKKMFLCQESHLKLYPDIETSLKSRFDNVVMDTINYTTDGNACSCEYLLDQHPEISGEDPILVSACDNGIVYDEEEYKRMRHDDSTDVIVFSFSEDPLYPEMYAWLDVDEETRLIRRVSVKKTFTDCENKYAIIGTMLFKKASYFRKGMRWIRKNNIRTNNEFYVDNMLEYLIRKGIRCRILNVRKYLCWGTPDDYKTYMYWSEYFLPKIQRKKQIYFIGYQAWGDFLTNNGFVRHLLQFYEKVNYVLFTNNPAYTVFALFIRSLFRDIHPDRIGIITETSHVMETTFDYKDDDVINTTHWKIKNRLSEGYSTFPFPGIKEKDVEAFSDNASDFYFKSGLLRELRLRKFDFIRNFAEEEYIKDGLLMKNNLSHTPFYYITNHGDIEKGLDKKGIPWVSVHYAARNQLMLLKLIEDAEEIHLIENSTLLMIYYMQYQNIIKKKNKVFLYRYLRDRGDYYIDMHTHPLLENWTILDRPLDD